MKKYFIFVLTVVVALQVSAQDPEFVFTPQRPLPKYKFELPDSLSHMIPWEEQFKVSMQVQRPQRQNAPKPSIVVLQGRKVPRRVFVNDHNVLQMRHLTISNGQGWNWGPFLDSFLDARTISVPM